MKFVEFHMLGTLYLEVGSVCYKQNRARLELLMAIGILNLDNWIVLLKSKFS